MANSLCLTYLKQDISSFVLVNGRLRCHKWPLSLPLLQGFAPLDPLLKAPKAPTFKKFATKNSKQKVLSSRYQNYFRAKISKKISIYSSIYKWRDFLTFRQEIPSYFFYTTTNGRPE